MLLLPLLQAPLSSPMPYAHTQTRVRTKDAAAPVVAVMRAADVDAVITRGDADGDVLISVTLRSCGLARTLEV